MFQPQATMSELSRISRNLGVSLHSGVDIVKAFELAGRKTTARMQAVMSDVVSDLKSGSDVTSALISHGHFFPELFIGMVQVGEATGSLAEVLKALGQHYENNLRLRREFIGRIAGPVVQLVVAIVIIAGLIALLGWIGQSMGNTQDVLGWGLLGTMGALLWLGGWSMAAVGGMVAYRMAYSTLSSQRVVDRFLLNLPVIGHCLRSFAIARFAWAFHLTQEAGMPIDDSIESSLRATSNGAFIAASSEMNANIRAGDTLTEAFQKSDLFPIEFMEFVTVAEQSGTVPEALARMSPQFEEDARRSLQALASAVAWTIWAAVAGFIIFVIFAIVLWYVRLLGQFS